MGGAPMRQQWAREAIEPDGVRGKKGVEKGTMPDLSEVARREWTARLLQRRSRISDNIADAVAAPQQRVVACFLTRPRHALSKDAACNGIRWRYACT